MKCHLCKGPVWSPFYGVVHGRVLCVRCYQIYDSLLKSRGVTIKSGGRWVACARCGLPITEPPISLRGRVYCGPCAEVVARCFTDPEPVGMFQSEDDIRLELKLWMMIWEAQDAGEGPQEEGHQVRAGAS